MADWALRYQKPRRETSRERIERLYGPQDLSPLNGRPVTALCGTYSAYQRHRRRGEEPCPACKEARRLDSLARRRVQGIPARPVAECGTPSGYNAHRRRGEPACNECREAKSAAGRERYRTKRAAGSAIEAEIRTANGSGTQRWETKSLNNHR